MIPIDDYAILDPEATIKDAIEKLKEYFPSKLSTSRIMETGHRSFLVIDSKREVQGILVIIDLLQWTIPPYLSAANPLWRTASSIRLCFGKACSKLLILSIWEFLQERQ